MILLVQMGVIHRKLICHKLTTYFWFEQKTTDNSKLYLVNLPNGPKKNRHLFEPNETPKKSLKLRNSMLLMVKLKNDKVIRDLVIRVQATRIHYNLENTEFEGNNAAILPINYKICYIMNNRSDFQQRKNAFINRRD